MTADDAAVAQLVRQLASLHGDVISAAVVRRMFGWSATAFRAAADQGTLPFRTFHVTGKRGLYARSAEVARALHAHRRGPPQSRK